jgi:transposase
VTVARDRGGGYGEATAKALPHADQVADRWHLMENASRAFLDAVSKSMRNIRKTVGSTIIDPKLLTYAERLQYEGYLRRQETNEAVNDRGIGTLYFRLKGALTHICCCCGQRFC